MGTRTRWTGVSVRRAVSRVRKFREVSVVGRDAAKAKALAQEFGGGLRMGAFVHIEDAVRAADVVCACTHSAEPVVRREWIKPGTHVNSVGYNTAGREIDGETVAEVPAHPGDVPLGPLDVDASRGNLHIDSP